MQFATPRTLYAAMRGKKCMGVFSSEKKAKAIACDRIDPVECRLLEGSPASAEYACLAEGTQSVLIRSGDIFDMVCQDIGPCWGCNVQSAVAGLYGPDFRRRGLELSAVRLYSIDQEYPNQPKNLRDEFRFLCRQSRADFQLSDEDLAEDYIAHYLRRIAPPTEAELARRHRIDLITDKLLPLAIGKGARVCGLTWRRLHERITVAVARSFSPEELELLAVLAGVETNNDVTNGMLTRKIAPETVADILQRAASCIDGLHVVTRPSRRLITEATLL